MQLVIKIDGAVSSSKEIRQQFAESVAGLSHDGHRMVIVHGMTLNRDIVPGVVPSTQSSFTAGALESSIAAAIIQAGLLADNLSRIGLPSAALGCRDLGICRIRKNIHSAPTNYAMEISSIDPGWLDCVCSRGGVPILSNIVVGDWNECGLVNADHMAAVCAISWKADTMVFFTSGLEITDKTGNVIRWLDVNRIDSVVRDLGETPEAMSLLKSCKQAFKQGVRRVRILPVADIALLSLLYFSKIEHGTDLVLSRTVRDQPELLAG